MYQKEKNKITIFDTEYFDIGATLECGQVFRYNVFENYSEVFSKDKKAVVFKDGKKLVVECEDADYFENYFDLKTDYEKIVSQLSIFPELKKPCECGKGIRILNQDKFETIISFIISANNNIKRIKKIIEKICENYGNNNGNFFEFPTPENMAKISEKSFSEMGCGYRARYLASTAQILGDGAFVETVKAAPADTAKKLLLSLLGVGQKVCDCILFFGFGRAEVFPTDTWIQKVFVSDLGGTDETAAQVSKILSEKYGRLSAYAQQYFFHYKRNIEKTNL